MPLHDWTDERGWDSVHPLWLTPRLPLPLNVYQAIEIDLEETYQRAAKRAYLD